MPYTSAMLGYLLGTKIPTPTLAFLGTPTESTLQGVLYDSIRQYDITYTLEAQCTDTTRFNAIGVYRFYEWAVERMQSAAFQSGGGQSEFQAHVSEMRKLRDFYLDQIPSSAGGAPGSIIQSTITNTTNPYAFPRYSDR
jgi:hypothetical protein